MLISTLILLLFMPLVVDGENSTALNVHGVHSPIWLRRSYRILCCLGGYPISKNSELVLNVTYIAMDHDQNHTKNYHDYNQMDCNIFHGSYIIHAIFLLSLDRKSNIQCACPDMTLGVHLDKNCRPSTYCINNGYPSYGVNSQCVCPEPYFGSRCEKFCDEGRILTRAASKDICTCMPFYQGEECKDIVCLNGGRAILKRCVCPPNFHGYHCEVLSDSNANAGMAKFHTFTYQNMRANRNLFTRDISGTLFSLIMIIILLVSMYLLMKHRMQVRNRFAIMRREPFISTELSMSSRHTRCRTNDNSCIFSSRIAPDEGPPPYSSRYGRDRTRINYPLPPLPSYEDAAKLSPIIRQTAQSSESAPSSSSQQFTTSHLTGCTNNEENARDLVANFERSDNLSARVVFTVNRPSFERISVNRRSV